ncbi:hypothetical protein FRB96_004691 [Tulasnella sp. 330]|nr:hypothetical protein FRB96_004691 [Tulasnella sp. 330]
MEAALVSWDHYESSYNLEDMLLSITNYKAALALCPLSHPDRLLILNNLGLVLSIRFEKTGALADLDQCIEYLQVAILLLPPGHPQRSSSLNNLGVVLRERYEQTGKASDLDECIASHQEGLELCPIGHIDRSASLNNFGVALRMRFEHRGDPADLTTSVTYLEEALLLRPIGHPDRFDTLNNLGVTLGRRFDQGGNMADLDMDISHLLESLALLSTLHTDRPKALSNLGAALLTRYRKRGQLVDLEQCIAYHREALQLFPSGHPYRSTSLHNLGTALDSRCQQSGNLRDLEEAITYHREALLLRPIGHPNRPSALNGLGCALLIRFLQTGQIGDLDECITLHDEALRLHPLQHASHLETLNNLGVALQARFRQSGEIDDLELCIKLTRESLPLCPTSHPDRLPLLNNLGTALQDRFEQTNQIKDLNECIDLHNEALLLRSIGDSGRSKTLTNLAVALLSRYTERGKPLDLEQCIHHHREALLVFPIGHPSRATSLHNLGMALCTAVRGKGDAVDLDEGVNRLHETLLLRPTGHANRSRTLNALGIACISRFRKTGSPTDLDEGILYLKESSLHTASPLSDRLLAAENWISTAHEHGSTSLGEAYACSLDLWDRSMLLTASKIGDKHKRMAHHLFPWEKGHDLTTDPASYAIGRGQLETAVEMLERGKAVLLTQLGKCRTAMEDLEVIDKELADRFRGLSAAVERDTLSGQSEDHAQDVLASVRRQHHASDWERTVEEIRQVEGFDSFLRATPFANLQKAAERGPIILINISRYRSDAVIVQERAEPLSIPLPDATISDVVVLSATLIPLTTTGRHEGQMMEMALQDLLRQIWDKIVGPIVSHLENTLHLPNGSRIWWIPTGAAWSLPLHASGPYKSGQRNLPDRFISSYAPNVSSLLRSRKFLPLMKETSGPRMLVVAHPGSEGVNQLLHVQDEVAVIREVATKAKVVEVAIIEGAECGKEAVLTCLKDATWAHFACHGIPRVDPFASHFLLETSDTSLTLLDIIKNGLPQAQLAVLSSCHSAAAYNVKGSTLNNWRPNEVINLAAGVLFAGFRSVVGTMWAMDDRDGPVIAQEFYKYMFRNGAQGVDCTDAAKALVMAVRELRRRDVPMQRWINLVHYGI